MKIEYPSDVKSLRLMLIASSQEVSRLSNTVTIQAEALRRAQIDLEKWERRFDLLLARP